MGGKEHAQGNAAPQERVWAYALDRVREAIFLVDTHGRLVYANAQAAQGLGYRREELLQLTMRDIDAGLAPDQIADIAARCLASGGEQFETLYRRRDGSTFPVEVLASGFEFGGQQMWVALARDMSARKAIEDALRVSEERMRLFFERQLVGMAITSQQKGWLRVNQKMCDMLGYTAQELMQMSWADVTHPDDLAADVTQFERMLHGEIDRYTVEKRYLRKDGGVVFAALSVGCVRRADGTVDYVLALVDDVSERKRHEAELRATKAALRERNAQLQAYQEQLELRVAEQTEALQVSYQQLRAEMAERKQFEERLLAVAANIPGFIFTVRVEPGGRTTFPFASPGVEDLFGVSPDDLRQDAGRLRARYHPDDLPRLLALMAETERTLGVFRIEIRIANREGNYVWTEIRSQPRRQPDGATEWHGIMLDIAARKQAELELEASRTQLRRVVVQREELRAEERKRMAREIHDELGQVLTGLRLQVLNLVRQCRSVDSPLCDSLQEISELTAQAMSVARNIAAVLRPVQAEVGIGPALELQASRFSTVTGIRCVCDLPDEVKTLNESCTTAIYRIVQELLTNVARHAQASEVNIAMRRDGPDYVVRVRDNGKGFDPAAVGTESYGLAGIRERLLVLGGQLDINSSKRDGTEVVVRIPVEVCHD